MKYTYFISYSYNSRDSEFGNGNTVLKLDQKISSKNIEESLEVIKKYIAELIEEKHSMKIWKDRVVVLNWIRI